MGWMKVVAHYDGRLNRLNRSSSEFTEVLGENPQEIYKCVFWVLTTGQHDVVMEK